MSTNALQDLRTRLEDRFGDLGARAARNLEDWLSGRFPHAYPEILERHLDPARLDLLFDAFWQVLPFGTGGRRGRVGYGPNRMNPTTVAMTVQGHCRYLERAFPGRDDLSVVVANDVRVFDDVAGTYGFLGATHPLLGVSSRSLARLACEIYAGNGIRAVFLHPLDDATVVTTPELSFLIDALGANGGLNLSASHNPPDDNGVKVYDSFGSQPIAPADQELVDAMAGATEVSAVPFAEALERGLVVDVPAEMHGRYVDGYVKLYDGIHTPDPEVPIVFTPLCGCALTSAGDVLEALGFPVRVPPEELPDGSFAPIPFKAPNPEVPQATEPARRYAEQVGSTLVLSSDPDADRLGMEVRLADGSWYHFDGNQMAAVLTYFLMLDPEGPRRRGLVVETLVTTKILGRIVEEAGDSWIVDDLLVGFKYVAEVLKQLATTGRYGDVSCAPEDLVVACEESHGMMLVPTIRDKDASGAAMYLSALHQKLVARGETALDYYVRILEELGGFDSVNRSIMMSGAEGMLKKDRIMESLRATPPEELGGEAVRRVADYWDEAAFGPFRSDSDRGPRNVVQLFTDAFVVTVRPSGTEPKLKVYCQLLPKGAPTGVRGRELLSRVRERADATARQVMNGLLARIDVRLDEAALLLPDIVDLDRKLEFQERTVPELRRKLAASDFADLESVQGWLREQTASMTPGTDSLPATVDAVALLLEEWSGELADADVAGALRRWARG